MISGVDSAALKMMWVITQQRKALDQTIRDYARTNPCELVPQPDGKETLKITNEPPPEIAVLSGEILYHFRSALDHLFFELVQRHGIPTSKNWERACQFPLAMDSSNFPGQVGKWVSAPALTFIEGLQPYHRGQNLAADLLWFLSKLSKIDKHRNLSTTVVRVNVHDIWSTPGGLHISNTYSMLENGAQLEPISPTPIGYDIPPGTVNVKRDLIPIVAFNEATVGPPQTCPVQSIIDDLPSLISSYITPRIKKLLSEP